MKFLPQAAQYHGHLWRQNYDDQIVNVRPGSVTYWPDFKIKTVNWSLRQEEWQKKRKKENKNKTAFEPRGINQWTQKVTCIFLVAYHFLFTMYIQISHL